METQPATSKYITGELINKRYRVIRLLGQGGMAEVYLAEDTEMHNKQVALKLLFSHVSVDRIYAERFIREVEITQKHSHPNIVRSYHYGKTERNEQYFTMEYVDGRTLADILKEKGKIPYHEVLFYLIQAAAALSEAHKLGIIHRDIKPDNIIVTKDKVVKITDFGIAKDLNTSVKLTELEKGPKSYAYKAPELYVKDYDHRVDIYALGITAYELLTGSLPFSGERHQLLVAHLTSPIPKLAGSKNGIPQWFEEFVETCCAKKPQDRFQSAEQVMSFLGSHKEDAAGYDLSLIGEQLSKIPLENRLREPRNLRKAKSFINEVWPKYLVSAVLSMIIFFLYVPLKPNPNSRLIGDSLDLSLIDKFFQFRNAVAVPQNILIISVDESSYGYYGLSTLKPWPRLKMAELLEKLAPRKPKMVIFDYSFPEIKDQTTAEKLNNLRLAKAIKSVPVYLSHFLNTQEMANNRKLFNNYDPVWMNSDPLFEVNAKGYFFANILDTGIVRNFNLSIGTNGQIVPIADVLYGKGANKEVLPGPADMINYYGRSGTISNIPFYKVLNGEDKGLSYENKIIFVGLQLFLGNDVRQRDMFLIPFGEYMAGVEIHATTAGNILEKNWIERMSYGNEAICLFIISFLLSYIFISLNPTVALIGMVLLLLCWVGISYILFLYNLFFPGLLLVLILNPLAYLLSILKVYLFKKRIDRILEINH